MDQDFPEYLFNYINPDKIDLEGYDTSGCGYILPNGLIFLNKKDSLDTQVEALLHEILHLHPDFITYTGALFQGYRRDEYIEAQIEERAQKLKKQRSDIVSHIKEILKEAMNHKLNK